MPSLSLPRTCAFPTELHLLRVDALDCTDLALVVDALDWAEDLLNVFSNFWRILELTLFVDALERTECVLTMPSKASLLI